MYLKRIIIASIITLILIPPAFAQSLTSQNYTLFSPRIVSSAGKVNSATYSLNNVVIGSPYGGSAESAGYTLRANLIPNTSITIDLSDLFFNIKLGESVINSTQKIILKNTGDIKISCSLRVLDTSGAWSASRTPDGNGLNKYALSAIFTDVNVSGVSDTDFNESGNEDMVFEDFQPSTNTKFATASSAENGAGILPNKDRALWLKFTAPKVDTTHEKQHNLWLIIKAEEVN